jgi:hypothetical protein
MVCHALGCKGKDSACLHACLTGLLFFREVRLRGAVDVRDDSLVGLAVGVFLLGRGQRSQKLGGGDGGASPLPLTERCARLCMYPSRRHPCHRRRRRRRACWSPMSCASMLSAVGTTLGRWLRGVGVAVGDLLFPCMLGSFATYLPCSRV